VSATGEEAAEKKTYTELEEVTWLFPVLILSFKNPLPTVFKSGANGAEDNIT
jgi:hypothetical protein